MKIEVKKTIPEEGLFGWIIYKEQSPFYVSVDLKCSRDYYHDKLTFRWPESDPSWQNPDPKEKVFKAVGRFREKPKSLRSFAEEIYPRLPKEMFNEVEDVKKLLEEIDGEVAKYELFKHEEEPDPHSSELMSAGEKVRAEKLLKDEMLLRKVLEATSYRAVGEEDTRLMLYLTLATTKLPKGKVNAQITGDSSAGKTWVKNTILELFPPEIVESFTRITATSLDHVADSINWDGKILDVAEAEGLMQAIEIVKHYTDDSGYGSRLLIPEKDERTGAFKTKIKRSVGIPVFVTTTAKVITDHEFTNRLINIPVDLSEEQTKRINEFQRKTAAAPWEFKKDEELIRDFRNAFRLLKSLDVVIPYAEALEVVNPKVVRSRRDLQKILWLIKASALVHQYQRYKLADGKEEYIIANFQDLANALIICRRGFERTLEGLHESTVKVKQEIEKLGDKLYIHEIKDIDMMCFTVSDLLALTKDLHWTRSFLRDHLNNLADVGFLGKIKRGRQNFFWVIEEEKYVRSGVVGLSPRKLLKAGWNRLRQYVAGKKGVYIQKCCKNVTSISESLMLDILKPNDIINPLFDINSYIQKDKDKDKDNSNIQDKESNTSNEKFIAPLLLSINDFADILSKSEELVDFSKNLEEQLGKNEPTHPVNFKPKNKKENTEKVNDGGLIEDESVI